MRKHYLKETEESHCSASGFVQVFALSVMLLTFYQVSYGQTTVVLPGSFQSELGCAGDWMPDCSITELTESAPGVWEGTFLIPAGDWFYKVIHGTTWDENYGLYGVPGGDNIPLSLSIDRYVHFNYSVVTHLVEVTFPAMVTVVGSFQSEVGCSGDWQPECEITSLNYDADANKWYGAFYFSAGEYEYKVVMNSSWSENYGADGIPNGANMLLSLAADAWIFFQYDPVTHITIHKPVNSMVVLAGNFQSELGCPGDWQPDCSNSALALDGNGNWRGSFELPAGEFEFKVTTEGSWSENYGAGGVPDGPNMLLSVFVPGIVHFTYDPVTHITTYDTEQQIVVLPGSFQSELGCSGDWQPDCHVTQLIWDNDTRLYVDTFTIPAGNWEFKVAINDSWNENYGIDGIPFGPNIPLNLITEMAVTFTYDAVTHIVMIQYETSSLCVNTFYDANANNSNDEFIPMAGVQVNLVGDSTATQFSDAAGFACFAGIPTGDYLVSITMPDGFVATGPDSISITLNGPTALEAGMVCLGGANAKGIGFWTNKNGRELFYEDIWYRGFFIDNMAWRYLKNADGSKFIPENYEQLRVWMQRSNSTNMSYSLSAQLAAFLLNLEGGVHSYDRIVYTPGIGYGWPSPDFMYSYDLVWYTCGILHDNPLVEGGHENRQAIENLKNVLERANSDLNWVQQQPCNSVQAAGRVPDVISERPLGASAEVYPNPSDGSFNLRFIMASKEEQFEIRVLDINGLPVYKVTVTGAHEIQFGDTFAPGVYFIEIIGETTYRVLKAIRK